MSYSLSGQNTNLVQKILHSTGRVTSEMTLEDLGRLLDAAREEGRQGVARPIGALYTTRSYPCGCRAEGPGDVPAYCSDHGMPPELEDPIKVMERGRFLAGYVDDAKRYRWLCNGHGYFMEEQGLCGHGNEKESADKAIDEQMNAERTGTAHESP